MPKQTAVNRRTIIYCLLALSTVIISTGFWCGYNRTVKPLSVAPDVAPVVIEDAQGPVASERIESALQSGRAVRLNIAGCPNLHQVTQTLYRGAQPDRNGFENLKKLGIKTVVNLRSSHSDMELLNGLNMRYVSIPIDTWNLRQDQVAAFLQIATDPNSAAVFVHCRHGADRTGTMIAAYRIVIQNRQKQHAIREMMYGGFGYHPVWKELPKFLRDMDTDAIRAALNP